MRQLYLSLTIYHLLFEESTSNKVKTRRFRQLSDNIEDSRTPRVREPSYKYFLGGKSSLRERWKHTAEGESRVGRAWALWSADPPSFSQFLIPFSPHLLQGINSKYRPRDEVSNSLSRREDGNKRDHN